MHSQQPDICTGLSEMIVNIFAALSNVSYIIQQADLSQSVWIGTAWPHGFGQHCESPAVRPSFFLSTSRNEGRALFWYAMFEATRTRISPFLIR